MKKQSKVLLAMLCAVLLVVSAVCGTLAYLTDTDTATNTFTVGKVGIKLDEAKVNPDGTEVEGAARVKENLYDLMPGHTYVKDPMVTVDADSEESYIRMIVTLSDANALKDAMPKYVENGVFMLEKIVGGWDRDVWQCVSATADGVYEFRYYKSVSTKDAAALPLEPLFKTITIPGEVDNAQLLELEGVVVNIVAHAIQADGFADADAAWAKF